MPAADLIIRHLSPLITCAGPAPRRGVAQREVGAVDDGAVAAAGGTIVFAGTTAECDRLVSPSGGARVIDARGSSLVPGFVDPHTHAVFAGNRHEELRRRLAGASYAEIAASGGGIVATVAATRLADEDTLAAATRRRLDDMLSCGTTTCEVKSGYGLTTEAEVKMLRVIARLAREHPVDLVPTFMGAHEVPPEYRNRRNAYVDLVVEEMIPRVAADGLAEWCDVFCETGVFTPEESRRVLEAGAAAGLKPRIHADELAASGGSSVAAAVGARSADHLIHVPPAGIRAMADAGTVATLLPSAAFFLKLGRFAPARDLIAAGVPVALGMNLTFEEALVGATVNAACSIDRQGVAGSLEPGKPLDAVLLDGPPIGLIGTGAASIAAVIKRGRVVCGAYPSSSS
jgi:imidazolonepropionase